MVICLRELSSPLRSVFGAVLGGIILLGSMMRSNAEPVPDFSLSDWNETSPRYDEIVSPRDYQHQVSGYYFGDPG